MTVSSFAAAVATFTAADAQASAAFEVAASAAATSDRTRALSTQAWVTAHDLFEQLVEAGEFDYAATSPEMAHAASAARTNILAHFGFRELVSPKGDTFPIGVLEGRSVNVHATPFAANWCDMHQFAETVAQCAHVQQGWKWEWEAIEAAQAVASAIVCEAWFHALKPSHRGLIDPLMGHGMLMSECSLVPYAIIARARRVTAPKW